MDLDHGFFRLQQSGFPKPIGTCYQATTYVEPRSASGTHLAKSTIKVTVMRFIAILLALVALVSLTADVAGGALVIDRVDVGFHGFFKVGRWTPLAVTVSTDQKTELCCAVRVSDPDGNPVTYWSDPVTAHSEEPATLDVLFCSGRLDNDINIRIRSGSPQPESEPSEDDVLASVTLRANGPGTDTFRPALRQSARIWITVGNLPNFAVENGRKSLPDLNQAVDAGAEEIVVALESSAQLPPTHRALDGADAVIVADQYDLNAKRSRALRDWVKLGGHVVIAAGAHLPEYQNSRLADWIGESIQTQSTRISDLSGLESFTGQRQSITFFGRIPGAILRPAEGKILVSNLNGPILVRVPYGFGTITFLGLDVDRPPLSSWSALGSLCRKLVSYRGLQLESENRKTRQQLSQTGISDFASQLYAIQDDFPGIRRFSSWMVMGLMFLYLVIVGPVDYLVVHRLLKKPRLTWLTSFVIVSAVVVFGLWLATSSNGHDLRVNQLDLVDIDERTQSVRAQSWLTMYSPEHRRYRVTLQPEISHWNQEDKSDDLVRAEAASAKPFAPVLNWFGIPETAFGGMYRPAGFEIRRPGYAFDPQAHVIEGLPVPIWSTKTLLASWQLPNQSLVKSSLKSTGSSQLAGSFSHSLPVPIEGWLVAYGNRVFCPITNSRQNPTARLEPHRIWDLNGPDIYQRELRGYLTRTRATKATRRNINVPDILIEQTKYDPLNRDPVDLVRMLTFHEAAGGSSYTGLSNQTLDGHDLSEFLRMDRAILFGRVNLSAATPMLDRKPVAATRHDTFLRILMPVERRDVIRKELPKIED